MDEGTVRSCHRHDVVFLLHGLARSCWSMRKIGRHLHRDGFFLVPWRYRSTRYGVERHAEHLYEGIGLLDRSDQFTKVHFVTYSMGGIVVRAALNHGVPRKMGRIVMLAPPNAGSHSARKLGPYFGWLWKPLPQLSCDPRSYVCRLPTPQGVQIGIIAASRDRRVTVEQTHLPGETDHLIVPGGHTFIMNRGDVCRQTACFLREGRFATT